MDSCKTVSLSEERSPLTESAHPIHDFSADTNGPWAPSYFDFSKTVHQQNLDLSNKLSQAIDNTAFSLPSKGEFLKNISAYEPPLSPDYNVPTITITAVPVQPDVEVLVLPDAEELQVVTSPEQNYEESEVSIKVDNLTYEEGSDCLSPENCMVSPSEGCGEWITSTDSEVDNNANVAPSGYPQNDYNISCSSPPEPVSPDSPSPPPYRGLLRPNSVYSPPKRPRYALPMGLSHSHTFPFAKAQQKAYNTAQAQIWPDYEENTPSEETPHPAEEKAKPKTEPYFYRQDRESVRRAAEAEAARHDCILKPLPAPDRLAVLLAESQPKDVAQYTRKDWTEDEMQVETPFCGTLSILSHVGALVWFGLLVWQLKVRDAIEARKWTTVGHGWYRQRLETGEEFDPSILVLAGCFLGLSYLIILLEGVASYAEDYLRNFMSLLEAVDFIRTERKVVPKIVWTLEYYVTEKVVQTYTRLEDGHTVTSSFGKLPRTQKVSFELPIRRCVDVSGDVKAFHPGAVTRVEMDKTFGFINQKSAMQYERLKNEFLAKYPHRPVNAKLEEKLEVTGFRERITVYFEADGRHDCMRKRYFWLFTFAFLGWPYRWWFRNSTEKCRFTFVKLIELSPEDSVPP